MQTSEVPPSTPGKPKGVLRRIGAICLIIMTIVYVAIWAWDFVMIPSTESRAKIEENRSRFGELVDPVRRGVQYRLDQLKAVNPDALVDVYFRTLETTNCDWLFQCTPLYHQERAGYTGPRTPVTAADSKLFYHPAWVIYVPTSRTIRGTPHGLVETAKAIRQAGGWAVAMFVACTAIWAVLVLGAIKSKSDQQGPARVLTIYLMVMAAPFAIALMVSVIQWTAELALHTVGVGMAMLVEAFAYGAAAVSVIVGIPHVLRSPREVREAAEVLKHVS